MTRVRVSRIGDRLLRALEAQGIDTIAARRVVRDVGDDLEDIYKTWPTAARVGFWMALVLAVAALISRCV